MIRIFVDANIYLEAFMTSDPAFQKHIKALVECSDHLFVTRQIVDEVNRNKLTVASRFVDEQLGKISFASISLPGFSDELTTSLRELADKSHRLKTQAKDEASRYFEQLSSSSDSVSTLLETVFVLDLTPSDEEMGRARLRRERGNPPGKKADPLGDQISWEQLLSILVDGDHLFIASRDGDYCLDRGTKGDQGKGLLLMPFLEREVRSRIGRSGRITLSRSLVELIGLLPNSTKMTAQERRQAASVENRLQRPEYSSAPTLCQACEPDPDHPPHLIFWSGPNETGNLRTGVCNWCDSLSVKCAECGFQTPIEETKQETCHCGVTFRSEVELDSSGDFEWSRVVIVEDTAG